MTTTRTASILTVATDLIARGIPASIEHTGGGCLTLQVGNVSPDTYGDDRFELLAGPGYRDAATGEALFDLDDCYLGPDDDGDADPVVVAPDWTAERIADRIANMVGHYRRNA